MKFLLTIFISISISAQSALDDMSKVADKVINETSFEFYSKTQVRGDELQIVNLPNDITGGTIYAKSEIDAEESGEYQFGVSSNSPIEVWINGESEFSWNAATEDFQTVAYDMYEFPQYFKAQLKEGINEIIVESVTSVQGYFALAVLDENGMIDEKVTFDLPSKIENENHNWLLLGPLNKTEEIEQKALAETDGIIQSNENNFFNWYLPATNIILDDVINEKNSFTKHSYFEWHYANGQMLLGMLALADLTGKSKYSDHIKRFCEFTLENFDYFKYQYKVLNERSGFNHRLFRRIMLDDTGAPALPFIELLSRGNLDNAEFLVNLIADYVHSEQFRLSDGTLARPEPRKYTVWADDLFMSVPYLIRYAKLTGEDKYFDDAANQILLFYEKLFDPEINLYYHGWFSDTEENSVAHWGRANGWVIWAISEALTYLPENHEHYQEILEIYKKHVNGLVNYQDANGIWHQVIDKPESFEETSSSAMFTLGIARGVLNGWLDQSYKNYAVKGWEAISNKIDSDGTVHGICRGTGIGFDLQFYYDRETPDHDPRGLGAVLTAGVEVSKLLNEGE